MIKRITAIIISILIIVFTTIGFTGCREADKVNHNMSLAAETLVAKGELLFIMRVPTK